MDIKDCPICGGTCSSFKLCCDRCQENTLGPVIEQIEEYRKEHPDEIVDAETIKNMVESGFIKKPQNSHILKYKYINLIVNYYLGYTPTPITPTPNNPTSKLVRELKAKYGDFHK